MGEYIPYGTANDLFMMCITVLEDHKDTIIVVDEIDYAFRHKAILGTIRDLVDQTLVTIILFGMQDAKNCLLALNAHYFDRCNAFAEFTNLEMGDTAMICTEASEVEMSPDVVKWVHKVGKGCARQIVKTIDYVERTARVKNLSKVEMSDIQ